MLCVLYTESSVLIVLSCHRGGRRSVWCATGTHGATWTTTGQQPACLPGSNTGPHSSAQVRVVPPWRPLLLPLSTHLNLHTRTPVPSHQSWSVTLDNGPHYLLKNTSGQSAVCYYTSLDSGQYYKLKWTVVSILQSSSCKV